MSEKLILSKDQFKRILGEAIGFGSVCWTQDKVFDSESAIEYVEKVACQTVSEVEPDENSISLKQKIQQLQAENERLRQENCNYRADIDRLEYLLEKKK